MHTLSLLVLSEDGSPYAHRVLSKLASRMLQLVEPGVHSQKIHFQPAEEATSLGVRANLWKSWKSPNPRDLRSLKNLRRKLATKVLEEGAPGYVLFHFDGDRPWSARETSENTKKFELFLESLRPAVEANLISRGLPCGASEVQRRLDRICPVTPFYSIEAWLYQNTTRARELCERGCGRHLELIERWERDRGLLDELTKPKRRLCIGSERNAELAEGFTAALADALYELGKSFHAAVERLQRCPGIRDALRETASVPPRSGA